MKASPVVPAARERPGRTYAVLVLGVTLLAVSAVTVVFGTPLPKPAAVATVGLGCTLYGCSVLLPSARHAGLLRWIGVVVICLGAVLWLSTR